jgi:hypothetical protein
LERRSGGMKSRDNNTALLDCHEPTPATSSHICNTAQEYQQLPHLGAIRSVLRLAVETNWTSLLMLPVKRVCKQGKVSLHSRFDRSSPPIDLICLPNPDLSPVPPHDASITGTTNRYLLTSPILPPVSPVPSPHISIDSWSYLPPVPQSAYTLPLLLHYN